MLDFLAFVVISCFIHEHSALSALEITFRPFCYDNALYKCSINNYAKNVWKICYCFLSL